MKEYREMTSQELTALREELRQEYSEIQARGLSLNMARGKPDAEQLALSDAMWTIADASTPMVGEDGMDYRNLWPAVRHPGSPPPDGGDHGSELGECHCRRQLQPHHDV